MAFKHLHGHVDVPVSDSKDNQYKALGRWVASIRFTRRREMEKERRGITNEGGVRHGGHTSVVLTEEKIKVSGAAPASWIALFVFF